jgi:hypothetical protein
VDVQLLDVEWLLSTLFDASLLSPLSRRKRRLFFWLRCPASKARDPSRHALQRASQAKGTSKYLIPVPLIDLKFLIAFAAGAAGTQFGRTRLVLLQIVPLRPAFRARGNYVRKCGRYGLDSQGCATIRFV